MPKKLSEFYRLGKEEQKKITVTTDSYLAVVVAEPQQKYLIKSCQKLNTKNVLDSKRRGYFTNEYVTAPLYGMLLSGHGVAPKIAIVEDDIDPSAVHLSSRFLTNFSSHHAVMTMRNSGLGLGNEQREKINALYSNEMARVLVAMLILGEMDLNPDNIGLAMVGDDYVPAKIDCGQSMMRVCQSSRTVFACLHNMQQIFKLNLNLEQISLIFKQMIAIFGSYKDQIEETIRQRVAELQQSGFVWDAAEPVYALYEYNTHDNENHQQPFQLIKGAEDMVNFYLNILKVNLASLVSANRMVNEISKQIKQNQGYQASQAWQEWRNGAWLNSIETYFYNLTQSDASDEGLAKEIKSWLGEVNDNLPEPSIIETPETPKTPEKPETPQRPK